MSAKYKAFTENFVDWGVAETDKGGNECAVLYDPSFTHEAATAIAGMNNAARPPKDWFATEKRLHRLGIAPSPLPTVEGEDHNV